MTQFARPIEDAFLFIPPPDPDPQDSWHDNMGVAADLYYPLGQVLPNDNDYAESDLILGPIYLDADEVNNPGDPGEAYLTESTAYVCKLSETIDPFLNEGFIVRVRLAKNEEDGVNVACLVELRKDYNIEGSAIESEGDLGELIASETFENLPSTFEEYSFTVAPEEAESIDDFGNLYLRFVFIASLTGVYAP